MSPAATKEKPTIVEALCRVMEKVQSVGKEGTAPQQMGGYKFRGIDAVMNAVGPVLREVGVVIVPTVEEQSYRDVTVGQNHTPMRECVLRVRFTFYGPAGDSIEAVVCGEALDSGDKGTSKAHSVAYRTCLLQALTIPTDDPDPEAEHVEPRSGVATQPTRTSTRDKVEDPPPVLNGSERKRSPNQEKAIYAIAGKRAFKDNLRFFLYGFCGKASTSELSFEEAGSIIEFLNKATDDELNEFIVEGTVAIGGGA